MCGVKNAGSPRTERLVSWMDGGRPDFSEERPRPASRAQRGCPAAAAGPPLRWPSASPRCEPRRPPRNTSHFQPNMGKTGAFARENLRKIGVARWLKVWSFRHEPKPLCFPNDDGLNVFDIGAGSS